MDRGVLALFGIFMATGAGVMLWGLHEIQLAYASRFWPTVSGQITYSQVNINRDSDGTTYKPIVNFTYRHQGQDLTGNTIFFGGSNVATSSRQYADKFVQKYPVGETVTVYYNPQSPRQSVLEPGLTKKSFILFTFGSLFFLMVGFFGILFWLFS